MPFRTIIFFYSQIFFSSNEKIRFNFDFVIIKDPLDFFYLSLKKLEFLGNYTRIEDKSLYNKIRKDTKEQIIVIILRF